MGRPISNHTGQRILDPFCGSGSTIVAAHQLDRVCLGIEIDPGDVAVTLDRLTKLELKPELINGNHVSNNIAGRSRNDDLIFDRGHPDSGRVVDRWS
jgi:DNA modification methylase